MSGMDWRCSPLFSASVLGAATALNNCRHSTNVRPEPPVARRGRPRTPRDLIKHDIVSESHRPSPMEWRFRTSGRGKVVRLTPRFMATEVEAVLAAVKAGREIGRTLSYQAGYDFASGALLRLLGEFEPPAWSVHLVVPTTRYMP